MLDSRQSSAGVVAGIRNLLVTCAGLSQGDRLLIAYEPEHFGFFDADIRYDIRDGAINLGLQVSLIDVGFAPTRTALPDDLERALQGFDVVLFLSRLGDQLRFTELPMGPRYVVCFALNSAQLGSAFGTADYRAFCAAKRAVDARVLAARDIVLTCPAGTEVHGRMPKGVWEAEDTSSVRFPMSVFSPIPAHSFSGRVALAGFLTGTGSRYYDEYAVEFDGPLAASFEAGRLVGFEGSAENVAQADAHYDRISRAYGIDRGAVHSWHAGLHPGCGFPWAMRDAYERWSGAAFGNPRIAHFHTCGGYAPGEICWNVIDPTIEIDGLVLWEEGTFHLDRLPEGPSILKRYPCAAQVFANPDRDIGLR